MWIDDDFRRIRDGTMNVDLGVEFPANPMAGDLFFDISTTQNYTWTGERWMPVMLSGLSVYRPTPCFFAENPVQVITVDQPALEQKPEKIPQYPGATDLERHQHRIKRKMRRYLFESGDFDLSAGEYIEWLEELADPDDYDRLMSKLGIEIKRDQMPWWQKVLVDLFLPTYWFEK